MWYDSFKSFIKEIRRNVQITKKLLITEMNHDEINESIWKEKRVEWLPDTKKDVLCTVFSYARYCKAMVEFTEFSMKNCFSLPGPGWK